MNDRQQPGNPDNSRYAALYERLSRDDELQGPSNSIVNQQSLLEEFAKKNGYPRFFHFVDDGFTGTNFERPNWKS